MYANRNNILFAFHGCDEQIRNQLVSEKISFNASHNSYDWLGYGWYFWENNYNRALEWAEQAKVHPQNNKQKITTPSVLGVVVNLGKCLDLTDSEYIKEIKPAYDYLSSVETSLPENKFGFLRYLDCAVIEAVHTIRNDLGFSSYDSVRSTFWEGEEAYPGAGFRDKNHIQICIRNPNCIKALFIPRIKNNQWNSI